MIERPEGIIITVSQDMIKENGYRHWLRNFLHAMDHYALDWTYWWKQGNRPKRDETIQHVYLVIGGKIRFRGLYGGCRSGEHTFSDGETKFAKAWVVMSGPIERPPHPIPMKGFRGFRYTEKLF